MFPAVPIVDGGRALVQPTFVGDVADAIVKIIEVRSGYYTTRREMMVQGISRC